MTRGFALITENGTADVWVMDPAVNSVEQTINMPWWALDRVRSVQGVQSAVPLVLGSAEARFPNGRFQPFQVIGLDDATLAGLPAMRNGARPAVLRTPDAAAVDPGGTTGKIETPARAADQWPHGAPPSYSADAGAGGRRCVAHQRPPSSNRRESRGAAAISAAAAALHDHQRSRPHPPAGAASFDVCACHRRPRRGPTRLGRARRKTSKPTPFAGF